MPVKIIDHPGITEICLDWPEVRNSLGPKEADELRIAVTENCGRPDVNALILCSEGRAFCAGGNLPAIVELVKGGPQAVESTIYAAFQGLFRSIVNSPIPVIAAVDGAAVGLGADLALAGDITFVGSTGWLAQGWMAAGLVPATGGTRYVARRGGPQAVWQFLASDKCDAAAAERLGLAVAAENAREAAMALAQKLAKMPPAPLRAIKELSGIEDAEQHWKTALRYQVDFLTDPSFPERAAKLLSRS